MKRSYLHSLSLSCFNSALLIASACSNQSYGSEDTSKIRVGIVFDIGGKDDRSFNAAAWAGAKCAATGNWPDGTSCGKANWTLSCATLSQVIPLQLSRPCVRLPSAIMI